jgi:hypothetical protein
MGLEDGSDATSGVVGTENDKRLAIMQAINDRNDAIRAEELQDVTDDDTLVPFVVQDADGEQTDLTDEAKPDVEAQAEIERLAAESNEEVPAKAPERIKRIIGGKEYNLTLDEWLAKASKIENADLYLAEAARLRNEQTVKAAPAAPTEQQLVEDDLAIARAIQMGTEEEAVAALKKLRQAGPSVSPADIARTIDERLTFNDAIKQFRTKYEDIASDPVLNKMAMDTDARLIAQGDRRPYEERYAEIGENIRGWVGKLAKTSAPAQGAAKLERKAAVGSVPKAAAKKAESGAEEEKEESVQEIIAKMAASRGGVQWQKGLPH